MADPITRTERKDKPENAPEPTPSSDSAPEPHPTTAGLDKNPDRAQSSIPTSDEIKTHVGGDG